MAQAKGSAGRILFDWETSYGTPKTAGKAPVNVPFNSCDVRLTRALQQAATIRGDRNPVDPFQGNKDVQGSLVVPVDFSVLGYLLKAAIGSPVTTGPVDAGGTDVYTHTFKIHAVNSLPSFILERGFTDLAQPIHQLYSGCKVNTLELMVGGDGELVATLGIMGADETSGTTSYADGETIQNPFTERFQQFDASAEEGGAAVNLLREFKLSLANNLDGGSYVIGGGGARRALPEGIAGVSGSISALFEDDAILAKARGNTESSLKVTFASGVHELSLFLPELKYQQNSPAISGPGGVALDLEYQAYKADHADGSALIVVLKNTVASY